MNLRNLEGKKVTLTDNDGEQFIGVIGDYIYPEDNEPEGVAGIVIDSPQYKNPLQFNEDEIKDIRVIS